MAILIIGGTGLISTAITRQLVERGERVTLYNRGQRQADIVGVAQIHGDRTDYATFEAQMAQAGPFDCVIDMVAFREEDVQSAIRAFGGRCGQYIFCSTVDVYTKPAARYPITEDAERQPSTAFPYAWHKMRCERALERAHEAGNLNVTMIRPAWTYGEGGSLLHSLGWGTYYLDRLRKGLPIIVHGDGSSLWCACHRDDVARAFIAAIGNPRAYGKGYHVTGEEWLPWDMIHRTVAQALSAPSPRLVHIPTDLLLRLLPNEAAWCAVNFQFNNVFDNRAARADLGFAYTVPFAEGARRTVAWLEEHGQIEDGTVHPWYDRLLEAWERLGESIAHDLALPKA